MPPPEGEGLSPLLACSPPTNCGYQSGDCDDGFDYQFRYFFSGELFLWIFSIHFFTPFPKELSRSFCIYYTILIAVCQEFFEKFLKIF